MDEASHKIYRNRQTVAGLIVDVLLDKKTTSEALSLFPKDKEDISLKCAFDALIYREADEDLRAKIKGYAEIQDNFLEAIASAFKKNMPLPKDVIERYNKYHAEDLLSDNEKGFKKFLKDVKRTIFF